MRNRFPGPCKDCGQRVEAGAGYFEKVPGTTRQWRVRHVHCTAVARADAGKPLSKAQRAALQVASQSHPTPDPSSAGA